MNRGSLLLLFTAAVGPTLCVAAGDKGPRPRGVGPECNYRYSQLPFMTFSWLMQLV